MSGYSGRLREKAKNLKRELAAFAYALKDPSLPLMPRLLLITALAYALSPIDLIPDFIPVLGQLDDLLIVPGLLALALRLIPKEVMERARLKAEQEPLTLRKNPVMAAVIILIWALTLLWIGMTLARFFVDPG